MRTSLFTSVDDTDRLILSFCDVKTLLAMHNVNSATKRLCDDLFWFNWFCLHVLPIAHAGIRANNPADYKVASRCLESATADDIKNYAAEHDWLELFLAVTRRGDGGFSPETLSHHLHFSAWRGAVSIVKYLIEEEDVDINDTNHGYTLLDSVIGSYSYEKNGEKIKLLVEYLLDRGVNIVPSTAQTWGHLTTALACSKDVEIVKLIVREHRRRGIAIDLQSCLLVAMKYSSLAIVKYIVSLGSNVHQNNDELLITAVMRDTNGKRIEGFTQYLLQHGVRNPVMISNAREMLTSEDYNPQRRSINKILRLLGCYELMSMDDQ